jgi:hypothetical protein
MGDELFHFYENVVTHAARGENALLLAAPPNSELFLKFDEFCFGKDTAFVAPELYEEDDAVLLAVGTLSTATSSEAWALRCGLARDRCFDAAVLKKNILTSHCASTPEELERVHCIPAQLAAMRASTDRKIVQSSAETREPPEEVRKAQRDAWDMQAGMVGNMAQMAVPSFCSNRRALCFSKEMIESIASFNIQQVERTRSELWKADDRLGEERFISFVFAPTNHPLLCEAKATAEGGIRRTEKSCAYPSFVSVHNAKGASVPLVSPGSPRPNSIIVPDAVEVLVELHRASEGASFLLIFHECSLPSV